jgi:nitrite reductase/ring-hydroxylating ferredoxin subunit/DMSO/TMAO reductase YedYZ heme-binding membrane subunit
MSSTASPWAIDRVKVTLLLSLIFIYGAPFVPFLEENLVWSTVAVVGLLGLMAAVRKQWFDAGLAFVIALGVLLGRQKFDVIPDATYMFRATAIGAFTFLHLALLIGPLSRFSSVARGWYKQRRHLAVTTFLLAAFHESLILKLFYDFSIEAALGLQYIFFGFVAIGIMGLLALTSWDRVQIGIKLRGWNVIHLLSLAFFVSFTYYFTTVNSAVMTWHYVAIAIFFVMWLVAAPWGIARNMYERVNGWKQIHLLIYVAYISVIIHVWTGRAKFQPDWVQHLFWGFVGAVVLAHVAGWIKWIVDRSNRVKVKETIEHEGRSYAHVGLATDFEDGVGQDRQVDGHDIAVFKNKNAFIALAGKCSHQGGPIAKGKIENGYVVCPWHEWQYGVKDGLPPEGFKDCIPYYPTLERDGAVYVCVEPTKACKLDDGQYEQKAG